MTHTPEMPDEIWVVPTNKPSALAWVNCTDRTKKECVRYVRAPIAPSGAVGKQTVINAMLNAQERNGGPYATYDMLSKHLRTYWDDIYDAAISALQGPAVCRRCEGKGHWYGGADQGLRFDCDPCPAPPHRYTDKGYLIVGGPAPPEAAQGRAEETEEERAMGQLIDERDAAEELVSNIYYEIMGESPEWSSLWGHAECLEEIACAVNLLKAVAKSALTQPDARCSCQSPNKVPSAPEKGE